MFKYYVSMFGGWGVLSPNADTADDGEGGRGVSDEMLTLGSRGEGKLGLRVGIRKNDANNL